MRVSHESTAVFDEANLVSCAGLAPVLALAERAGLHELLAEHLTLSGPGAANAPVKVTSLVAGMIAGADSIDDMDVLRAMSRLFDGVRAPSTLGTFLRSFTFGHVRQVDAVAARLLTGLAQQTPLLAGADQITYLDIDDTVKRTYGYAKQGAGYGYSGVKGLNALLATLSTPLSAPVIAGCRLRKGGTNSARGASRLLADALVTARAAGASGLVVVRADSAFYNHDVLATAVRHGARFSVTARQDPNVRKSIEAIGDSSTAWTPIRYPNAVWDETEQRLISDAEVAEIDHTAFTSRRKAEHITGRLIVRRVRRLNPGNPPPAPSKGNCSAPGATTRCSPTLPCGCWPLRPRTAGTRSSSRSSPNSKTVRSRTCRRGTSRPTPPGSSWPRSRSTSPAPPAPSRLASTPGRGWRPYARNSSTSPRDWPGPRAASPCTSPPAGPGSAPGSNSTSAPAAPRLPSPPDHSRQGQTKSKITWRTRKDRAVTRALLPIQDQQARAVRCSKRGGGSRLSQAATSRGVAITGSGTLGEKFPIRSKTTVVEEVAATQLPSASTHALVAPYRFAGRGGSSTRT